MSERSGAPAMNRRAIVKGALGGVLALTLPPSARAAFSQASPAAVPVSDGLVLPTRADVYVFFRDANVLAAGDAISPLKDPVLDWFGGGWLGGRVDAQEKLLKLSDEKTRIVPSYGPVVGRAELQAEFDMTRMLFDRMLEFVRQGMR